MKVVRDMILYAIQDYRGQKTPPPPPAEEQAARSDLERYARRQERDALWQREGSDQFFFVMNLITQLAYQEGADRTGAVALDFSDIIRYTSDLERKLSTLREELNYAEALLRIQKAWWGDTLSYSVSAPKQYWGISCPFLIFRPIMDVVLQSFTSEEEQRCIGIYAEESGKDLLVSVLVNSESVTPEEMENRADDYLARENNSLRDLNRSLKRVMGKRCDLSIGRRSDGQNGYAIRLKLPLKWR